MLIQTGMSLLLVLTNVICFYILHLGKICGVVRMVFLGKSDNLVKQTF